MTAPPARPILELQHITKRYGAVVALADASLAAFPGEIHALLGENGAGKSTLVHLAYGMSRPDEGTIRVRGEAREFQTARDAHAAGIALVHQHFTSIPALTVAENVALTAGWPVDRALAGRVAELSRRAGLPLDPGIRAAGLPVALLQRLEIVKALATGASILLLDEPTAVLAPLEVAELLGHIRGFANEGKAVVLITHKLDEAMRAADRVTVLRRGRVVQSQVVRDVTAPALVRAMLGASATVSDSLSLPLPAPGAESPWRIRTGGLTVRRTLGGGLAVEQAWLGVRGGEIVAIAGIDGSGHRELLRAIAGLEPVVAGTLDVAAPLAFVPEDRTTEGIIPDLSLTENVVLGGGWNADWIRGRTIDWSAARRHTAALMERHDVRATDPDALAGHLSGGNQQKLILARALERKPAALVAENPTRGLDLQATRAVHDALRLAAGSGLAVLVYSSDLDEVLALGQRVYVMARGTLHEAPPGAGTDEVGRLMLTGASS